MRAVQFNPTITNSNKATSSNDMKISTEHTINMFGLLQGRRLRFFHLLAGFISHNWKYMAMMKLLIVMLFTSWQFFNIRYKEQSSLISCESSINSVIDYNHTAILYLTKPRARFHGNHWFHIGEYYLSRHQQLKQLVKNAKHVHIIAHETKVSSMMTRFPFFLIVLGLSHEQLESVKIFNPIDSLLSTLQSTHEEQLNKISFSSSPRLIYQFDEIDPMKRFKTLATPMIIVHRAYRSQHYQHQQQQQQLRTNRQLYDRMISQGELQHFDYNEEKDMERRLMSQEVPVSCYGGQYVGAVGPVPINTSFWFRNIEEVQSIRNHAATLCSSHRTSLQINNQNIRKKKYKMIIYQRNINRLFLEIKDLQKQINEKLSTSDLWEVSILHHNEDFVPCELYEILQSADMIVTAHGFQLTALIFMKIGAVIVEIFPYNYFRKTYFPLSTQFGIHHFWTQNTGPSFSSGAVLRMVSQETCMNDLLCRSYARSMDIKMPTSHVDLILRVALDIEYGRLGEHNLPNPVFK